MTKKEWKRFKKGWNAGYADEGKHRIKEPSGDAAYDSGYYTGVGLRQAWEEGRAAASVGQMFMPEGPELFTNDPDWYEQVREAWMKGWALAADEHAHYYPNIRH